MDPFLKTMVSSLDFLDKYKTTDSSNNTTMLSKPTSPAYCPASPAYCPASPAYCPAIPAYCPTSPHASPAYCPASPAYCHANPAYCPTSPHASPAYCPASPAYCPTSPHASPAYCPTSPAYCPTSPAHCPASKVEENNVKDATEILNSGGVTASYTDPLHKPVEYTASQITAKDIITIDNNISSLNYVAEKVPLFFEPHVPVVFPSPLIKKEHVLRRVFGVLNWVKASLIRGILGIWGETESIWCGDVGCGKGHDASKWKYALRDNKQKIRTMLLVDNKMKALSEARETYKKELGSVVDIITANDDITSQYNPELINSASAFHILQFVWSSRDAAEHAITYIADMFSPGGPVAFIYTDASQVLGLLRREEWNSKDLFHPLQQRHIIYRSKYFTLSCTSEQLRTFENETAEPFGHRIKLQLEGGPPSNEFLVPQESLNEMLMSRDMSVLIDMSLHVFVSKLRNVEQNAELARKLRIFGDENEINLDEWEALSLYRVCVAVHGKKVDAVNSARCWINNRMFGTDY